MVFLGKTREKGLKVLTKDKKKPAAVAVVAAPKSPTSALPADPSLKTAEPIHVSLPLQIQSARPDPSPLPQAAAPLAGGSPWWVSDVTFIVEGRNIPGHRVVLQSRSDYFTKFFQTSTAEAVTLEIVEFSHHIFSQFIRWIYGGKKDFAPQDIREIARCAQHFESAELLSHCQRLIEEEEATLLAQQQQQQEHSAAAAPTLSFPGFATPAEAPLFPPQHDAFLAYPLQPLPEQGEFLQDPHSGFPLIEQADYALEDLMLADYSQDLNMDPNFGMAMWSNDPVLYSDSLTNDSLRTMEIY